MSTPPAGWHPDPHDPNLDRWWDGQQWTDRTRRRGSTAATAAEARNGKRIAMVVAGVLALIGIGFFVKSVADQPSSEERAAEAAVTSAQRAAADARSEELRYLTGLEITCEKQVRAQLKAPSTAEFTDVRTERKSDKRYVVTTGAVDSQNSFGAQIRTHFTCTHFGGSTTVEFTN
ncbi:DUF2510 domain-containing protein [Rhodococcus ruber]|uniref:DUF2510 domain-containing protein n=1 Tax=Rhodococcus ruber TaxID=1830 RepID=UPI0037834962